MPNLDTLLSRSISTISSRLSEIEFKFLASAGKSIAQILSMSNDELRDFLYSGKVIDLTNADLNRIRRELNAVHKLNIAEMKSLAKDVTAEVYSEGAAIAESKGEAISPKKTYTAAVNPLLAGVLKKYEIMSKSTAVGDNYKNTISRFVNKVMSDTDRISVPSAMKEVVRELTAQGVATVQFGKKRMRLDSAVRLNIMGEFNNIVKEIQFKLAEELQSGFEITVEYAPAEDHAQVQGMIFTAEEFEKLQSGIPATDIDGGIHHLEKRAIGEYNCRHSAMPFVIGVSERNFSPEQLEQIEARNQRGINFNGEHMTIYEATQKQRELETSMRGTRENINYYKPLRDSLPEAQSEYSKNRARLAELRNEYHALGDKLKPLAIREKMDRSYIPRGSTGR